MDVQNNTKADEQDRTSNVEPLLESKTGDKNKPIVNPFLNIYMNPLK